MAYPMGAAISPQGLFYMALISHHCLSYGGTYKSSRAIL
jgi:hypothetical protein